MPKSAHQLRIPGRRCSVSQEAAQRRSTSLDSSPVALTELGRRWDGVEPQPGLSAACDSGQASVRKFAKLEAARFSRDTYSPWHSPCWKTPANAEAHYDL